MDNWHKCPNSLVDRLMGTVLSPTATCVVLTVWRLTEGVRERHQAAIPTETFMRVTKTNRKKTAYDYVNEALKTGLINVKKEQGKVNVYSINKKCPLWYIAEVVAESVPSTESATSGDNCHIVVAESAIGLDKSSGGKCHPYKDIKIKDNIKDKKKVVKPKKESPKPYSPEKPESVSDQIWNDLLILRKETKASNSQTAWTTIFNGLEKAQQATGHSLDQIITFWISKAWKGFNADWYQNAQPKPQQTNYQGNNNGSHQSANSQPKQQLNHFDQLRAEAAAKYGRANSEPRTVSDVT